MVQYFFDIDDGEQHTRDDVGIEIVDRAEVRRTAIDVLPDIAREKMPDGDHRVISVKVRNAAAQYIFMATLSLAAGWLEDDDPYARSPVSHRRP